MTDRPVRLRALTPEVLARLAALEDEIVSGGRAGSFSVEWHYPSARDLARGKAVAVRIVHPSVTLELRLGGLGPGGLNLTGPRGGA